MVLVLYKSSTDQMVTIAKVSSPQPVHPYYLRLAAFHYDKLMTCFQVTSFGGRTVQEKYPSSLWRRLTYIPVGDSPEERAAAGTFLNPAYAKLDTTNNNAFARNCYVSVAYLPVVWSRNLSNLSAGRVIISAQQLANLRLLHAHII